MLRVELVEEPADLEASEALARGLVEKVRDATWPSDESTLRQRRCVEGRGHSRHVNPSYLK
jgi:hypothetical protein